VGRVSWEGSAGIRAGLWHGLGCGRGNAAHTSRMAGRGLRGAHTAMNLTSTHTWEKKEEKKIGGEKLDHSGNHNQGRMGKGRQEGRHRLRASVSEWTTGKEIIWGCGKEGNREERRGEELRRKAAARPLAESILMARPPDYTDGGASASNMSQTVGGEEKRILRVAMGSEGHDSQRGAGLE